MHNMLHIHSKEPPPSPWPVFGMFHQLPQGSCVHSHTQKYTIFNIFTVAYYSQTSDSSYLSLTEALWKRAKRDTRALLINKITSLAEMFNGERKEEQTDEYPVQVCSWNG